MILSGLECVAVVAVADTDFSDTVWLTLVNDEGEYTSEFSTVKDWNGQFYNLYKKHEFKFSCINSDKFLLLDALAKANTPVNIFGYGVEGGIIWRESSVITTKEVKANKPGAHQILEVSISAEGSDLDILVAKNMLRDTLRTCDYGITSSEWTFTNTVLSAPVETANPLFSGKTYKLDNTADVGNAEIKEFKNHFPVRAGMKFGLRADVYSTDACSIIMSLAEYAGSYQALDSVTVAQVGVGSAVIDGVVTITDADTTFVKLQLSVDAGSVDIGWFDNLQLTYKSSSPFQRG